MISSCGFLKKENVCYSIWSKFNITENWSNQSIKLKWTFTPFATHVQQKYIKSGLFLLHPRQYILYTQTVLWCVGERCIDGNHEAVAKILITMTSKVQQACGRKDKGLLSIVINIQGNENTMILSFRWLYANIKHNREYYVPFLPVIPPKSYTLDLKCHDNVAIDQCIVSIFKTTGTDMKQHEHKHIVSSVQMDKRQTIDSFVKQQEELCNSAVHLLPVEIK